MSYADDWSAAKKEFEDKTDLKKPTAKGSLLFVSWRKPSGIEEALTAVDKAAPSLTAKGDTPLDQKVLDRYQELTVVARKKATAYLGTLEEAIKKEKEAAGKSDVYRQQKVLKASLDLIVSRAEQQHKFAYEAWLLRKKKGSNQLDKVEQTLASLNQIGTNMKVGIAEGTKFCKAVMAKPTVEAWNKINTDYGARRLSQPLTNICKFVYADHADLLVKGRSDILSLIDDERMTTKLSEMNKILGALQGEVMALGQPRGSSAFDGSIGFLGNSEAAQLPPDASEDDIRRAVKHFAAQLKRASDISQELKRFGF